MTRVRYAVHLGYHKTATSWLQREIFPRHPRLHPMVVGSPHGNPFLAEIIGRSDREFDPERARHLLAEELSGFSVPTGHVALISAERLSGHAATGGYDTFRIAGRLHAVVPDAKIFFTVREQVGMIESEYRQLVLEGSPAKLHQLLHQAPNWVGVGFDLCHYEYDRLADEYVRQFGREQVHVFSFEQVTRDQAAFLAELAGFLEIGDWPDLGVEVLTGRVNTGISTRLLGLRRVMNHFEHTGLNPEPLFTIPPVWRTPIAALSARLPRRRRPLIDSETQDWLHERFRGSNLRLAERHGVDLSYGLDGSVPQVR